MIKNEKRLIIIAVGIPVLAILIITLLYSFSKISPIIFTSILIGIIISAVIFLLGVLSINFCINKSDKLFLMVLWGSFLFKLILGLVAVLITLIFLEINTYGFIFSILFFYIFYLIIEIIYLDLRRKSRFDGK